MKVYKFGGASIKSSAGIRNVKAILGLCQEPLVIVVSALGKTTNALEILLNMYFENDPAVESQLAKIEREHCSLLEELVGPGMDTEILSPLFAEVRQHISGRLKGSYDFCYDQLVSYGELLSTKIVYAYLIKEGVNITWLDARKLISTDSNFREAGVNLEETALRVHSALEGKQGSFLIQGFLGGNIDGYATTLGREGSDYSAAVLANVINAESVTIWKDVSGILNADPKEFKNAVHLPGVSYQEAVELSFFGAQIIHPKTIKPLQNKGITLFVKPFQQPNAAGTIINAEATSGSVPVYVIKHNQVLISIRPKDFSFVLEETLSEVFPILSKNRVKINMVQSSAITISICVDGVKRYIQPAMEELKTKFNVLYNENLELFTIRNYRVDEVEKITSGRKVYMLQKTRRTLRILVDEGSFDGMEL
ncbi:aspartate kinase [Williamwhitmania taraxaci]|uniref:Aspartokinase n=1 Tax=Williamwhitmania taraxaci TaxID=1640674 RepID=A0A1G6L5C5_9BACT|nr:aspartate kinase [Williamwhitmania taraxaci]SDC38338.1 aspartate kinase [Williamwhitmania taraxaci]